MKRGDIVIAAERGRLTGKPRPWLIVQSSAFTATHAGITVCLISSTAPALDLFRVVVEPDAANGLEQTSTIMIDALMTVSRASITSRIGVLDAGSMTIVDAALRRWLDL